MVRKLKGCRLVAVTLEQCDNPDWRSVDPLPSLGQAERGGHLVSVEQKERIMSESVYKVIELVGTSSESWEKAAAAAVETAMKSLRDLRVAEVSKLDIQIEDGKIVAYRARVMVSFKYHTEED